jgi:hypothetical protein
LPFCNNQPRSKPLFISRPVPFRATVPTRSYLDEYFMNEALIDAQPKLRALFGELIDGGDGTWRHEETAFVNGQMPPVLSTWNNKARAAWDVHPDERFEAVAVGANCSISLVKRDSPSVVIENTTKAVLELLTRDRNVRRRALGWNVLDESGQSLRYFHETENGPDFQDAARKVEWLWDGMRSLPYTDEELAQSIGNYLALVAYEAQTKQYIGESFGACWGKTAYLELGMATGAYQRAICSASELWKCARSDLRDFFVDHEWGRICEQVSELLGAIIAPDRVFEFPALANLFARQIVPSQLHIANRGDSWDPIFFSPAQIQVLGQA